MRSLLLAVLVALLTTTHASGSDNPRRPTAAARSAKSLDQLVLSTDRSVSRKYSRKGHGIEAEPIIPDICKGC